AGPVRRGAVPPRDGPADAGSRPRRGPAGCAGRGRAPRRPRLLRGSLPPGHAPGPPECARGRVGAQRASGDRGALARRRLPGARAACAGCLVAGLGEDLPRHAAGLRHTVGAGAAILSAAAVLGGWVPMLASWSAPPSSAVTGTGPEAAALAAVQGSAAGDDQF